MARELTAEFAGTLLLLATVVGSGIMAERLADDTALALLGNTVATGAMLVVLITMFGPISGAHFNPAVTLAFLLSGEIGRGKAAAFVGAQILGGLAGVWLAHGMFEIDILQASTNVRSGGGQWLAEAVATFGLVATILLVLKHKNEAGALCVGLYITGAYWFTASTSFANPAVTIARGFTDTFSGIEPTGIAGFIAAQVAVAVAATYFCRWITFTPSSR